MPPQNAARTTSRVASGSRTPCAMVVSSRDSSSTPSQGGRAAHESVGGVVMNTYVLVHGAWLGAWSWDKVARQLEQAGGKVIIPELPGHGDDQTPVPGASLS